MGQKAKMIKPTDETLMAYADGRLDPSWQAEIERLCAEDPALRARLRVFLSTGRDLGRVFQHEVDAPVPKRLLESVEAQALRRTGGNGRRTPSLWSWLYKHVSVWHFVDAAFLRMAAVASVATTIGVGLGWLLHRDTPGQGIMFASLVQAEKSRLIARWPLQHSLDTLHSGTETKLTLPGPQEAELKVKMTFRDETRDYCRVYEIETSSAERYAGVACRMGDQWSVRMQAMFPPSDESSGQLTPAGVNNPAMNAVVRELIDDGPLSATEEAAVIGKGWKE
jgi:hypothetical protein